MKMRIQAVIESENGSEVIEEFACLKRGKLLPETLGLTLSESKSILRRIQGTLVPAQVDEYIEQERHCPDCGRVLPHKGQHEIVIRSLFGKLTVSSPRFYTCTCRPRETKSVSPVTTLLNERMTPELRYLAVKAAALESYDLAVHWLGEVLPLEGEIGATAVRRQVAEVAEKLDAELSDEEPSVEGCLYDWARLPDPDGPITVGLDGGYVPARKGECPQATAFEAIIGKSIPAQGKGTTFAFVQGDDDKARQRLYNVLESQGVQANQLVTFLTDGGNNVRDLPLYLYPNSEHILDWFHVTMRLTVMGQQAKGVKSKDHPTLTEDLTRGLESLKWYLWHGNVYRALQVVEGLEWDLDLDDLDNNVKARKLRKSVQEFDSYIRINHKFIPNYGELYRYGERISTGFTESAVNQVLSKRMSKKQQMRWTRQGAHHLLQIRTVVLNGDLRHKFAEWYPGMQTENNKAS